MVGFKFIDHTADVGMVAYGKDLKELFTNAVLGLFSLIVETDNVAEKDYRQLEISADDKESLLVQWLNELIYLFEVDRLLPKRFDILALSTNHLEARAYGEVYDPSRHKLKTSVKAATYHMLKIERTKDGYEAEVIFDI